MVAFGNVIPIIFETKGVKQFQSSVGRIQRGMAGLRERFTRFKMELLGVLFFGMALQKMFLNLTKGAMEMFGVFDILNTALAFLFLETGEKAQTWALKFLDTVFEMDAGQKELVNTILLWIGAIGTLALVYAILGLGIRAVIAATLGWTKAGSILLAFLSAPFVVGLGLVIGTIAAVGAALLILAIGFSTFWPRIRDKWKELEEKLPVPFRLASQAIRETITPLFDWIEGKIDELLTKLGLLQERATIEPGTRFLTEVLGMPRHPYGGGATTTTTTSNVTNNYNYYMTGGGDDVVTNAYQLGVGG